MQVTSTAIGLPTQCFQVTGAVGDATLFAWRQCPPGAFPGTARIHAPLCVIRGEWDSLCTDTDARWLWDALAGSPLKREVKLSKGTHLMHLQEGCRALYRDTLAFLGDGDAPAAEAC